MLPGPGPVGRWCPGRSGSTSLGRCAHRPSPAIPKLPGRGPQVCLFDTSAQAVRPTSPGEVATLYVCGITPYDSTHLGHAATYVAFDLLQRAWIDAGHRVHYVQNITDVDDPLLARAAATGQDWQELAAREEARFVDDMTELRLRAPDEWVSVVESIPHVLAGDRAAAGGRRRLRPRR